MTDNNHPITPPPELQEQWKQEWLDVRPSLTGFYQWMLAKSAQWGADQELEACCEWLDAHNWKHISRMLRAARRPKPKSLAEQKQAIHDEIHQLLAQISANNAGALAVAEPIRHALKRLQWLEEGDE